MSGDRINYEHDLAFWRRRRRWQPCCIAECWIYLDRPNRSFRFTIIDELPIQWQIRDFKINSSLKPSEEKTFTYQVRPTERGEYHFGHINIFISTFLGLIQRRLKLGKEEMVPVYPSIIQMKHFSLKAFDQTSHQHGIKKMRRIGQSYEFEQIKEWESLTGNVSDGNVKW